ncbi:hypothetical protein OS493_020878 [Desmophyllum pertusum]|uniref:Uncharacterized protein n=1 Tax=Desmophyllum pertusum TaxID=174260 RepID=A0A9W9YB81_9CNID|nr:hypothetical protein OS493_020878 [Desmophyllum pertusum]
MALTATTTNDTMTEITHTLGMYKCTEIKASSNRPNIMYNVKKMKNVPEEEIEQRQELLDEIFGEVVNNLQNNGKKAPKAIVFCFLRNDCAIIYEYFLQKLEDDAKKEIQSQETIKHNCCDICASTCECEDCLLMEAMDAMEIDKYDENSVFPQVESECHKFNIEQKKVIEKQLVDLRESISQNACLLSADHSLGFTTQVVKQIVESCDSMITVEHVLDKADIWDATLAQKVLDILENVAK